MKVFARTSILCCLMALAFLTNPDVARAQNYRNCAWPIELSPEGSGNMLGPDTLSRYWVMPFDTTQYETMTIKGAYPMPGIFLSSRTIPTLKRCRLPPRGTLFTMPKSPLIPAASTRLSPGRRQWDIYCQNLTQRPDFREYNWGFLRLCLGPSAGVRNPRRSILKRSEPDRRGASAHHIPEWSEAESCPSVTDNDQAPGINKLADVINFLQIFFPQVPTPFDLIGHEGTPSSDRLWFAAPTTPPPALLPNPHNKYIAMLPGDSYQPGRIIVIHGKLPGTPDTYNGSPIWVPARGFPTVDMRYWSLCNNDLALPVPVVNCTADLTTDLQGGDYTIVISDDLLRPDWLRPDINWLPWGDAQYLKIVFARNMLPAPTFPFSIQKAIAKGCTFPFDLPYIPARDVIDTAGQCAQQVMGDYYPVAAWCDKSTFVHGGWRACMKGK